MLDRQVRDGWQPSRERLSGTRGGFTLLEVSLAITVLVVGLCALSASAVRTQGLARSTRERMAAQNAVRAKAEEIQSISRAGLADPLGWGTHVTTALASLVSFPVEGLTAVTGAANVGSVQLITDETATDAALGAEFGMPRDLDGDGVAGNTHVSTNAKLLPVLVRVRWTSEKGVQESNQSLWILGY